MGQIRVEEAASLEYYLAQEEARTVPDSNPVVNGVKLGYPAKEGTREETPPYNLVTVTKLIWDDSALQNGEAVWDGKQWQFNPDPVINQPPIPPAQ